MSASTTCRSCGSRSVREFLSLGQTPIANALVRADSESKRDPQYPLALAFCASCSLVQLAEGLPSDVIFSAEYPYYSSFSDYLMQHSREHAQTLLTARNLGPTSFVVEVASNDGYLLRNFVEAGIPVLGIDPSPGPVQAAREAGVPTLLDFFGREIAQQIRLEHGRADVIIANNVMAHVPDLNGFVAGLKELVADDGIITVENPYVRDLIEHGEFDTIYHEHYSYFSCTAVDRLVRRHGLFLNDVEYFPSLHGGTLRWHIGPQERVTERAREYLANEQAAGLTGFDYYRNFGERVQDIRRDLLAVLTELRAQGKSIAAYGAAAKGSTLVNFAGIGTDLIDFVVDRNVHKQGLLMPGVHLPIRPVEALLTERPDYVLMLAWNFKDEIIRQQSEYLAGGGRFIVPVPHPQIIETRIPAGASA